jgi:phytoene dehydrogenase-like protein
MNFDAIVIGAGVNGLAAAVHLSAKGWKVAVLERNSVAGGAVKTAELTLPGFRHDLYAMNLGLFAGSPFFARHHDLLLAHGLDFVASDRAFASLFPGGTWLGVERDAQAVAARIGAFSAADAKQWQSLSAEFPSLARHIFAVLGAPMPSFEAARAAWNAWRAKGYQVLGELGRLLVSSPRAWLDAHFESPQVKALMAVWGLHLDFAPDIAGGAIFPYLESMASQAFGMTIGKGGADTIIKAMVAAIETAGGQVKTNAPVDSIVLENGRAVGVRLHDGTRFDARKAVIANVHPRYLFGHLLPREVRDGPAIKAALLRPGPATMMVHLAMDDLPNWPDAALRSYAYVHLAPDMKMMARTYAESIDGLLPSEPILVVGQPTAVDPSRAPDGKHVLWIQVRTLPYRIAGDASGIIAERDWGAVKEVYADRVLDILERYAPGTQSHVLARHVASPLDLEADVPNLVQGDSLGGSHHLDQNFLFRPAFGRSRYRTGIANLHMIGASTWPGGGTGGGSGFLCAKQLAGA